MNFLLQESCWNIARTGERNLEALDQILDTPLVSVTDKAEIPPSCDKRDYLSIATYFWPDPKNPDGPWLRRDGEASPYIDHYDRRRFETMVFQAKSLIIGLHATNNPIYARQAGKILRHWFLDPVTRMNPNLKYAQFIPGVCEGRGIGIIDTTPLIFLLDAIAHLPFNPEWTENDQRQLRQWFSEYLDWLLTSENGIKECGEHNNHGSWYDAQVVAFACFVGRPELAEAQIQNYSLARIEAHIAPDGSQPHELARTLSLDYSVFNLLAFLVIARFAEKLKMEFGEPKKKLEAAYSFLKPYLDNPSTWPYPQIKPFKKDKTMTLEQMINGTPFSVEVSPSSASPAALPM